MIFMYISLATILHSDSINNLQQREDREKHETSLQNIASECYSIVKERDQLLDKSNKFQAQMRRLRNHQFRCGKNADSRSVDAAVNGNVESLDMDDLTKSIWAGALINNQSKPKQVSMESIARSLLLFVFHVLIILHYSYGNTRQATKASDRATKSQELYLKKKREGSNAPTQIPKTKIIRNWNLKED